MKKIILILLLNYSPFLKLLAQNNLTYNFVFGRNFLGTGDTKGLTSGFEIQKNNYERKIKFGVLFLYTLNDGSASYPYEYPAGNNQNLEIRYTIAGIQISPTIGILPFKNKNILFQINPLLRYQSSSYWDDLTILYPTITGLNYPVAYINNQKKLRTISFGVMPKISLYKNITEKLSLGVFSSFQFDSEADNIFNFGISIGTKR